MRKHLVFTVLALIFAAATYAADNTATATWLLINAYPEYAAKGAASGAVSHGIAAADLNPAAIAGMDNVEFAVMHNQWRQGISTEMLSFGKNFEAGSFALEFDYNNLGSVPVLLADQFGNPVLTTDIAAMNAWGLSFIYAKKIRDFSLGMALKIFSEDLSKGPDYAGCADVGFVYTGILTDKVDLGVSLLNISTGNNGFYTPIDLKAAMQYTYSHGGSPVIDVVWGCDYLVKEGYVTGQAGFDYYFFDTFLLRGGISIDRNADLNFTAGAGIKLEGMTINYSYEPDSVLGDAHKISVSAAFGKSAVSAGDEDETKAPAEKGSYANYMESGDYYYNDRQYRQALKYYEYINLLYWKDLEDKPENIKSSFFQKLGICYYNLKDNKHALSYFERALYFDKENEILKHWIKSLK